MKFNPKENQCLLNHHRGNESVKRKRAKSFGRTDSKTTIDRTTSTITVIGQDDEGAER